MTVWSYVALMPQPHATKLSKQIPKNCLNIALISKTQVVMHIGVRINLILPFLHLVLSQYSPRILGTFRILLQFLKLLSGAKEATTTDSSSHNKNHDKIAQDCHLTLLSVFCNYFPLRLTKNWFQPFTLGNPFFTTPLMLSISLIVVTTKSPPSSHKTQENLMWK